MIEQEDVRIHSFLHCCEKNINHLCNATEHGVNMQRQHALCIIGKVIDKIMTVCKQNSGQLVTSIISSGSICTVQLMCLVKSACRRNVPLETHFGKGALENVKYNNK